MAKRFQGFVTMYSEYFQSYRHNVADQAHKYLFGLMQAGKRKNMERMSEVIPDADARNLQQFLTHSKWDARAVMDRVARDVNKLLGDPIESCLLIDETGFKKQGGKSAGVSRQWLGRIGKVDNGQVAVFGVLAKDGKAAPVDARLYLPKSWTDDPKRCKEAGIPEEERVFRTKIELAAEVVRHARCNGLKFGWVGADAGYGKGLAFITPLTQLGEDFVIDIHRDFHVYDEEPVISCAVSKRGKTEIQVASKPFVVGEFVQTLPAHLWQVVDVRDTTRGLLRRQAYSRDVYVRDSEKEISHHLRMVVSRSLDGDDVKISLARAPIDMPLQKLIWRQMQRYWVERVFEDAKGQCGMADYQVRKWTGWQHHMALVILAMLFMLEERFARAGDVPSLTCADIELLLSRFLPRRDLDEAEVLRQMENRHRRRRQAINSHARRTASQNLVNCNVEA